MNGLQYGLNGRNQSSKTVGMGREQKERNWFIVIDIVSLPFTRQPYYQETLVPEALLRLG
jgi:hypothetical protein